MKIAQVLFLLAYSCSMAVNVTVVVRNTTDLDVKPVMLIREPTVGGTPGKIWRDSIPPVTPHERASWIGDRINRGASVNICKKDGARIICDESFIVKVDTVINFSFESTLTPDPGGNLKNTQQFFDKFKLMNKGFSKEDALKKILGGISIVTTDNVIYFPPALNIQTEISNSPTKKDLNYTTILSSNISASVMAGIPFVAQLGVKAESDGYFELGYNFSGYKEYGLLSSNWNEVKAVQCLTDDQVGEIIDYTNDLTEWGARYCKKVDVLDSLRIYTSKFEDSKFEGGVSYKSAIKIGTKYLSSSADIKETKQSEMTLSTETVDVKKSLQRRIDKFKRNAEAMAQNKPASESPNTLPEPK